MGKMKMRVLGEERSPVIEGSLGGAVITRDDCQTVFGLELSSSVPVWISWSGAGGVLRSDDTPAMNGQTVTGADSFKVFIPGYRSPAIRLNNVLLTFTANLYTEEGGTLIATKDIKRYTTGSMCTIDIEIDDPRLDGNDDFLQH